MSSKKNKKEPKETSDKPAKDKKESKKKGDVKEGSKKKEEAGGKKKVDKKEGKKEGKKGAKKSSEKAGKKKGDAKKSTKPKGGPFAKLSDPLLSNIFSFLTLEDHLIGLLGVSKRFRTLHHYPECWPPELDFDFDCGADHDHDDHDHDHGHEHFPVEAFLRSLPSDNIKLLDLSYRNVDPSVLEILSKWPKLTAVNATGCEWINDQNVARLASLPLKELSLSECDNINDVGVAQLKGMKLEKLELRELKITNLALDVLQGMQLKVLDLDQVTAINNQGLEKLSHLTTLETLRFGGAQIDDEGLKHLAPLSNLKELFLEDCRQLNGSGLKYLRKLPLNTLSLQGTNVTDNSLYYLTPLKLEEIDLWRCPKITEDGLVYLGGIKTLHAVSFSYLPSRVMQHFVNLKLKFLAMLGVPIDEYGLLALRRHHLAEMQLYHCNMDEDLMEALDEISPFVEINGLETCGPHIPMEPPADQFTLPEGEGLGLFGDGEEDDEDDDEDDDEEAAPFEFDFGGPTHTFGQQQQSGVEITEVHDDDDENEKGEGDESLPEDEEGFDAEDID